MPNWSNHQWEGRGQGNPVSALSVGNPGGDIRIYTASGTLLVGDVVYFSAANTVAKSATQADYIKFAGVVVGGESLQDFIAQNTDLQLAGGSQLTAALTGKRVIVQITGEARVIGGAVIAAGTAVTVDTGTAGRVLDTGATAGQIIGTIVTAATVNGNTKMLIRPR